MDGKIRTIEPTRAERERRLEASMAGSGPHKAPAATPIGFDDTIAFQHRVITLDDVRRDRERILTPGAIGEIACPYKMLRTQVMGRLHELRANTLAVLSASNGDGKTLTAINLAIAIAAESGHTALLIDLDLRRPAVARRLGFEVEVGVEDCLMDRRPVYEAMIKIAGYERLTLLPARSRTEQSSELIASQRMVELMQELRTRYLNRVLVFDLPPVLLADDALAFSRHVQAGLFVVSEGKTAREDVTRSLTMLRSLPILGTVLNHSRESSGVYY